MSEAMERYTCGVRFAGKLTACHATHRATVSISAGRWMRGARITICNISRGVCEKVGEGVQPMRMIYQGKFKMQAHVSSGVVMYIAAFKVSHSVDVDATTLPRKRARNVPAGRWNVTRVGFDSRESSPPATQRTEQRSAFQPGAGIRFKK